MQRGAVGRGVFLLVAGGELVPVVVADLEVEDGGFLGQILLRTRQRFFRFSPIIHVVRMGVCVGGVGVYLLFRSRPCRRCLGLVLWDLLRGRGSRQPSTSRS